MSENKCKSFLKWVGGKRRIASEILDLMPDGEMFYDAMCGSGSMGIAAWKSGKFSGYHLNDINVDLIRCLNMAKDDPASLISSLEDLECVYADKNIPATPDITDRWEGLTARAAKFYQWRDRFNKSGDPALLVALNKLCFNGLYRVNKSGEFNVPFGGEDREFGLGDLAHKISKFSKFANNAEIGCQSIWTLDQIIEEGSVAYFDPPYIPLTDTANYTAYTKSGFGPEDQERLAAMAWHLGDRGIPTIVSNSGTDESLRIFSKGADVHEIQASRSVGADGDSRGKVDEYVFTYGC